MSDTPLLLRSANDLDWCDYEVQTWWGLGYPEDAVVAAVSCVLFDEQGRLVLATIKSRGFDVPGGRREGGEDVVETLVREVSEEVGVGKEEYSLPELLGWLLIKSPVPELLLYYRATLFSTRVLSTQVPSEVGAVARFLIDDVPEEARARAWYPLLEKSVSEHPVGPADGRFGAWTCARWCSKYLVAGKESSAFRCCIQLSDNLKAVNSKRLCELVEEEPEATGEPRYDALIAAIVEYECVGAGVATPAWTQVPERFLAPGAPWYREDLWYLREEAEECALPIFRSHGVLILPSEFESA